MFNRTRLVLEEANKILTAAGVKDGPVSQYLTEYILVIFYGEVEEELKSIIGGALTKASNEKLSEFLRNTLATIIKRLDKKDICKTVAFFGKDKKEKLQSILTEELSTKYQNYINNRHNIAHPGKNVDISWNEVQSIIAVGENVMNAIQVALREE